MISMYVTFICQFVWLWSLTLNVGNADMLHW